jgi:pantoate--beta-alanine ligase
MQVFERVADWRATRRTLAGTLGFVPTMGALHAGHLSLIERSLAENDATLVSIFVNPTQFENADDLATYPDRTAQDRALLAARAVPYLWMPSRDEMYADDYRYRVSESDYSRLLCGAHRHGHFDGVLTVVMKLLNVAQADRAYFGEKDYQQLQLVKGMVDAFFVPTEIVPCPTVREDDGLALSSRNVKLSPADRARAAAFPRALTTSPTAADARAELEAQGFGVDYVEDRDGRRFGAVRLGDVRLIDNVRLPEPRPLA